MYKAINTEIATKNYISVVRSHWACVRTALGLSLIDSTVEGREVSKEYFKLNLELEQSAGLYFNMYDLVLMGGEPYGVWL